MQTPVVTVSNDREHRQYVCIIPTSPLYVPARHRVSPVQSLSPSALGAKIHFLGVLDHHTARYTPSYPLGGGYKDYPHTSTPRGLEWGGWLYRGGIR